MAVTPNYGWPVPVATDFVKDGWEAISDLGNAIDTTVAALPSGGLTLISTTSFTAATAVNFTNVFSSAYSYYKLVQHTRTSVSGAALNMRARMNTSDYSSTGYYAGNQWNAFDNTNGNSNINNGTVFSLVLGATGLDAIYDLNMFPSGTYFGISGYGLYANVAGPVRVGGYVSASSNVTGFTLSSSSGTFTGSLSLFGFAK